MVLTGQASAVVTQLTFEGLQDQEQILDFYNGGTGSMGSAGPNLGVSFGSSALALIDADDGGIGNFANEPSPNTIAFWLGGTSLIMNVSGGFDTGFSFFYTSSTAATVTVWDGLDATGNLLGSIDLIAQFNDDCVGDPTGTFCNWDPIGVAFAGTAMSVNFGGTANQTGYDNITFGTDDPRIPSVPEPGTLVLLGVSLFGLRIASRSRHR